MIHKCDIVPNVDTIPTFALTDCRKLQKTSVATVIWCLMIHKCDIVPNDTEM